MKRLKKTKVYQSVKAFFSKIKSSLDAFGTRRIVLIILGVVLLYVLIAPFFQKTSINAYYETNHLAYDYSKIELEDRYSSYLSKHGTLNANIEQLIPLDDMTGSIISLGEGQYEEEIQAYYQFLNKSGTSVALFEGFSDEIKINTPITKEGYYYISVDYRDINPQINDNQLAVTINDDYPYYEARTIQLPSDFYFETTEFQRDRYQNEIQPTSLKVKKWMNSPIKDYDGLHPGFFAFYLKPGDTLRLEYISGKFLLGEIRFIKQESIPTYEAYLNNHAGATEHKFYTEKSARELFTRSSASIHLRAERDPSSEYYETQYLILNTISGNSWLNGGERINYEIEVAEDGFYNLSFKYRQVGLSDMSVFRKIYVNGEVPYKALEAYAFPYTNTFLNRTLKNDQGENLKVFLNKGTNIIGLEVVNYPYRNLIENIRYVMGEIQGLSLAIKKYTSGGTDKYRDWDIETYFPEAQQNLYSWAELLLEEYESLKSVSSKQTPTEIQNLKVAASRLKRLAKSINKLPSRMVQFSDGDSSVSQLLGDLMQRMMRGSMELEKTIISNQKGLKNPFTNPFIAYWEGLKRLVLSYVNSPYSTGARKSNELVVWVNHPRQYIEIMQMLIDKTYDSDMRVTLSQMPDENKLILANTSGQSPDVAIGVNHWLPYEFAIRDASLDLRQFQGFEELVSNMSSGAFIPFVFEEGVFGLPETQNFWVTYYRRDILTSIGIEDVPQTWDEIINILPILQSYGMNFYLPLSSFEGLKPFVATLPFIYQFGGNLYTEDGMETAINSEETIAGIKLMSDLFTLYNIPQRVGSFYNDFRYGKLPIGIGDLSMYLLLTNAAVELDGLWGMDLHPGQPNKDNEILRYAPVGGQASMILSSTKHKEESFKFLKWWMSTETQTEFQFRLETTYGKQYFWNSANVNAFLSSSMPSGLKEIVLEQWNFGIEAARIPGAYMVERSISNAWSQIVYSGSNPRLSLDEAVRVSNREIKYKMSEFGYVKDNVVVKPYIVPSIYNIHEWLTEVPDV